MIQLVAFVKVMSAQVFVLTSSLNFDTFGESDSEENRVEAHKRTDVSLVLVFCYYILFSILYKKKHPCSYLRTHGNCLYCIMEMHYRCDILIGFQ